MTANYAPAQPQDKKNQVLVGYPPAKKALATYGATAAASSVVTLTDNTTEIEVEAVGGNGVAIRWIPATETAAVSPFASVIASGTTANFDHIVPAGIVRRFVVPVETTGVTSIVGANKQNGLYNRVAWINVTGSASVFGTEF